MQANTNGLMWCLAFTVKSGISHDFSVDGWPKQTGIPSTVSHELLMENICPAKSFLMEFCCLNYTIRHILLLFTAKVKKKCCWSYSRHSMCLKEWCNSAGGLYILYSPGNPLPDRLLILWGKVWLCKISHGCIKSYGLPTDSTFAMW